MTFHRPPVRLFVQLAPAHARRLQTPSPETSLARSPFATALALLLLAGVVLAPSPAGAIVFTPYWQLAGWNFLRDIGNIDSDPQDELLFESKVDGHLALVDGLTGVVTKEFTEFKAAETQYFVQNIDADPLPELILCRIQPFSGPYVPLTRAYKRTPGGYTPVFSHTDSIRTVSLIQLRSASQTEFYEISDNDIRIRDLNGTVLFKASSAVAGWTGVDPYIFLGDLDGDGVSDLGVTQNAASSNIQTFFFHYSGGFNYTWSSTSWFMEGGVNLDGDAHEEIQAFNLIDGRYAFFDGVSGTPDLELPEFTSYNNSTVFTADVDGDGRREIFASRPAGPGVTPLVRAYKWVAGSYVQMFTHTQEPLSSALMHSRSATQSEFLIATPSDIILRDALTGTVVFRASTQIPGWSGSNMVANPADLDNDGILELVIQDDNTARVIRYAAGVYTQLWSSTAWRDLYSAPDVDDQALNGLFAAASSDGHRGLLDPLTGAVRHEFPTAFLASQSYILPYDFDHDGRYELLMIRNGFSVSPLTTCYRWNGSSFATMFSHQNEYNGVQVGPFRSLGYDDLLELGTVNGANHDIRVRAFDGSVVFSTSTDIPGWTGVGVPANLEMLDVNHDGLVEFLATDGSAVRMMHYIGPLGVEDLHDGPALRLTGESPNPFRASTSLRFSTRAAGDVGIAIYDASGRVMRRLDQRFPAGSHQVRWDGRDEAGRAVPNGILFYEVSAGGVRQSRKLVRIGR